MRLLIITLMLPCCSYAQVVISGKVVEAATGNPIPYATVGLAKQNTGTNANEEGQFSIGCLNPDLDSFVVSCIGYVTGQFPVKDFMNHTVLSLPISQKQLKPVIVKNRWDYGKAGTYKKSQDYCFTSSGYHSQVAKKMLSPSPNAQLQSISVRTSKNYPDTSLFRIHVYDFDTVTGGPGKEITDTLIEVRSNWGMISIDLSAYDIWLPGTEFFISLEWLRIPFNKHYSNTKYQGKDTVILTYNPCICFTKDTPTEPGEIWHLAYSGKWYPRRREESSYSLAISATLKY